MSRWSWSWSPVVAIGAAASANAALIALALAHPPDSVGGPRSGSGAVDSGIAARRRFADAGGGLEVEPAAGGLSVRLTGATLTAATVACERPDSAALDALVPWTDTSSPLAIALPRAGRWTVRVTGRDATGAALEGLAEVLLP